MEAPQLVFFEELEEQSILIKNRDKISKKSDKDLSWRDSMDYAYIKTSSELEELLSFYESYDGYIAFDYETTGLDPYTDVIVGVSFAHKENYARYIPIRHKKDYCFDDAKTLERIGNILKTKKMIAHNGVFEYKFTLMEFGVEIPYMWDTQVMSYVDNNNESSGLKQSCKKYFNQDMEEFKEVTGGMFAFQELKLEDCYKYACCDSDITYRLFKLFESKGFLEFTKGTQGFIVNLEQKLIPVTAELELNGIGISLEETQMNVDKYEKLIADTKSKIWVAIKAEPESVNLDSPQQVGKLFYNDLGLTVQEETESGKPAVNADALEKLRGVHPVVDLYLEYKSLVKVLGYYTSYIEKTNPKTGKIHCGWMANSRGAGRIACVTGDTLIRTPAGDTPMKELKPGMFVLSHRNRYCEVEDVWITGVKDVYRVSFSDGHFLDCTEDHRIWYKDSWRYVYECKQEFYESRECSESVRNLSKKRLITNGENSGRVRNYLSQCFLYIENMVSKRRIQSIEKNKILREQGRDEKSNEGEMREGASQLQRVLFGKRWVLHNKAQRKKDSCSTLCYDGTFEPKRNSKKFRSASCRWESFKQLYRKFSAMCVKGAPCNTPSTEKNSRTGEITGISYKGRYQVFDCRIAKDHSYWSNGIFSHNCSGPNLQNVAEPIREVFKPQKGYYFAGIDYSAIEGRLLVSEAGAEKLVDGYNNGEDIHKLTASMIYGCTVDQVTTKQRKNAKTFTYGMAYGMAPGSMAESLGCTKEEAKRIYDRFFQQSPKIKEYMDNVKRFGHEFGYSVTPYGRRKYLPKINSSDTYESSSEERLAVNSTIQGHAADIMKLAMIRVRNRIRKLNGDKFDIKNDKIRMILTIHDELVFEISEELDRNEVINTILDGMIFDLQLKPKYTRMSCDVAIGYDWKNLKDVIKDENGNWNFPTEEPKKENIKLFFKKDTFSKQEIEILKVILNADEKIEVFCLHKDKTILLGKIKNDENVWKLLAQELNINFEVKE